ncbi:hypothetical protein BRO54_0874 [Geobacillus proteiniphilus]|uniref:Uncharacterized protein n=1 Tax=Geobacillus proteiniphilus TaxID=860353 RepID=A0A1Q5T5C9_9BACL|nr:hypothetical protein BRO54_0874 [Geobacillus proteiniphilus]
MPDNISVCYKEDIGCEGEWEMEKQAFSWLYVYMVLAVAVPSAPY